MISPTPDEPRLLIGTAGWGLARDRAPAFPAEGTTLQRYAGVFPGVEINSSFHRPHRPATYARWAAGVPERFRFSVKLPRTITHGSRLAEPEAALDDFLTGVRELGTRLGCLLVQLPPSLSFEEALAARFFSALRHRHPGGIACEPRHESWLAPAADSLLREHRVARVAADPDRPPGAALPGGWPALRYFRLHGSPRIYYSAYERAVMEELAARLRTELGAGHSCWCVFDNTVLGEATGNALTLLELMGARADDAEGIDPLIRRPS